MATSISPNFHDLVGALTRERQVMERLLFRHAEISMLIAAGEHRFVGRALDEAMIAESELAETDLLRALLTVAIEPGLDDVGIETVIAAAPSDVRPNLETLARDMRRIMAQVDLYREQASNWAADRANQVRGAIDRFDRETYADGRLGS
jgi:hypothetical protein